MNLRMKFAVRVGPGPGEPELKRTAHATEVLRLLESQPQPRRVRIAARGAAYALLGVPGLLVISYYGWIWVLWPLLESRSPQSLPSHDWFALACAAFCWFLLLGGAWRLARDRALLATGSFTAGNITCLDSSRWLLQAPPVRFRFEDDAGGEIAGSGHDYSGGLYL